MQIAVFSLVWLYEFRRCFCTCTCTCTFAFTFIDMKGISANETLLECIYMLLVLPAATQYRVDKTTSNPKMELSRVSIHLRDM